jgi:catechol 2,3-dioxygenase-like lactoylglutathione lyase family enzyme
VGITVNHRLIALDHVQLAMPVGAEQMAVSFYDGLLALSRLPKPPALELRGGCWFSNGEVTIHLGAEEGFVPARKAHPALVVDDLDALVAVLGQAGHAVRWDDEMPGVRRCYVDDPFGNRIELIDASGPASTV